MLPKRFIRAFFSSLFVVLIWCSAGLYDRQTLEDDDTFRTNPLGIFSSTAHKVSKMCTFDGLRHFYQQSHHLPHRGRWVPGGCADRSVPDYYPLVVDFNYTNGSSLYRECRRSNRTVNFTFKPKLCSFEFDQAFPDDYLERCFSARTNDTVKMVTMGDSNGRRYYDALIKLLESSVFVRCETVKSEHGGKPQHMMDVDYFHMATANTSNVITQKRGCHSCSGIMKECTYQSPHRRIKLVLEHIPLLHFREGSYKVTDVISAFTGNTVYFPEFIFRYYFANNYPDMLIILSPFNHEKLQKSLASVTRHFDYFINLLDTYVPTETKIMFLSTAYETEQLKNGTHKFAHYSGYLANEMIQRLNYMMYDKLEGKLLNKSSNYYSFFDLGILSDEVLNYWSSDGAHKFYVWYEKIMSQLLQLMCS